MKHLLKSTLIALALATLPATAQEFSFKFQSSDPAGNPNFELQQGWTETLAEKTGGRVKIELLPVGSVVEHNETQDAIAAGILDGHITDTSYFAGKDPAFSLIANPVGAWSDPQQMFDFMNKGGGKELMNELVEPYGLHFIGATTPGLEAFVSKVPLDGVDDLKGLKMRAPEGLVQQVFAAAGAAPVNLPGSEVFTSLDKGVIDAADYTLWKDNFGKGDHAADFNRDGFVDMLDRQILIDNLTLGIDACADRFEGDLTEDGAVNNEDKSEWNGQFTPQHDLWIP